MSDTHETLESSDGSGVKDVSNHAVGLDLGEEGRRKESQEGGYAEQSSSGCLSISRRMMLRLEVILYASYAGQPSHMRHL